MQTTTGLTWAWELTSPEPISEGKRQDWERQLERDREKERELMETAEGFLRGNELPVLRSEQLESVKPCVLEGVSNVLSEAGSRVGRVHHNQETVREHGALLGGVQAL